MLGADSDAPSEYRSATTQLGKQGALLLCYRSCQDFMCITFSVLSFSAEDIVRRLLQSEG